MTPLATPDQVAEYLGVTVKTLTQWRYLGQGPVWHKVGGKYCRYKWSEVEKWLAERAIDTT
ncbi:helix-turn-helix transcriptional regulator [Streptomyces sp. NPDC101150]|uniref:helix-turn-helix transcriptional regulator n=1 Tax=Streptomyces sp. NPDC101150 TaxID=3366114 RepID=UPI0038249F0E